MLITLPGIIAFLESDVESIIMKDCTEINGVRPFAFLKSKIFTPNNSQSLNHTFGMKMIKNITRNVLPVSIQLLK